MYEFPPTLLADFYKIAHRPAYPSGTEQIYATWIARASRIERIDHVVAFGFQSFLKRYLVRYFNWHFFYRPREEVISEYERVIRYTLGVSNPDSAHIGELHDIGYLPLLIRAVPEGTRVPVRVPMLTIENTRPEAFWLTNYIETLLSSQIWHASTSATLAYEFRKLFDFWAEETGGPVEFVPFQGHDFSMRGMSGVEAAALSGAGHLLSFVGTDTIPAIVLAERDYGANVETELVGTSVPATEHSVVSAYGKDSELEYFRRVITEVYPEGIVSCVSDTFDLWNVVGPGGLLHQLKGDVLARNGKVVIRPDSGRPADIMCGDPKAEAGSPACIGVIECLWNLFGGVVNAKGYRELDTHIGAIYGDAISYDVASDICSRLAEKGFASTNMVYGIGSFTYQYVTRDTFSFALKSTSAVVKGQEIQIWKDPVTDPGAIKKSLVGRVVVREDADGRMIAVDHLSSAEQNELAHVDMLKPVFQDGKLLNEQAFSDIRKRLHPCGF